MTLEDERDGERIVTPAGRTRKDLASARGEALLPITDGTAEVCRTVRPE